MDITCAIPLKAEKSDHDGLTMIRHVPLDGSFPGARSSRFSSFGSFA
jgi:hypothetical protein